MMRQKKPQQNKRWSGGGFTLLELLVAMIIIAVLAALLLPAINSARRNVRVAQVKTEITQLEQALANFKAKYGQYPPSYIRLRVGTGSGTGWNTNEEETIKSREIIKSFWPDFDFSLTTGLPWSDGDELFGAECLVFFLGGVDNPAGSQNLVGFSKNPTNPFLRTGNNRDRPLFEFDATRIIDETEWTTSGDWYSYLDPLSGQSNPYLYLSSSNGSYDSGDLNGNMTGAYSISAGNFWKPQTFQIISPGEDGLYGTGGVYTADTADTVLSGTRSTERDNITNFHSGALAP